MEALSSSSPMKHHAKMKETDSLALVCIETDILKKRQVYYHLNLESKHITEIL